MAYTVSQIVSFVLFLILICLSVILVVISSTNAKHGGGFFSSMTKAASSAASAASSAALSTKNAAASMASAAGTTAADLAMVKKREIMLTANQIKLTPKEYLDDMKLVYDNAKFTSYLNDTKERANKQMTYNSELINEYDRRKSDSSYVQYKSSYPDLIAKYTKDNEEAARIIADCDNLLNTTLVPTLISAISPIIDSNIEKMTTTKPLRGTDFISTAKQAAINFSDSLPKSGPTGFGVYNNIL